MSQITTDKSDELLEGEVLLRKKHQAVLAITDATVMGIDCPACGSGSEGNEMAQLENGQYLYIGNCCGLFTHCEVTPVVKATL